MRTVGRCDLCLIQTILETCFSEVLGFGKRKFSCHANDANPFSR